MRRIVLFTQRVEVVESYQERRDCADQRIGELIQACGYLALPVPNCAGQIKDLIEKICPADLILTGGNSLEEYGGNAPERDATDSLLIRLAEERRLPLYGFCRGMQSVLDYYGNKLEEVEGHAGIRHTVRGEGQIFEVNSYHRQGCLKLEKGCGLHAVARAEDGVIEEICHDVLPIEATMWHPEREPGFSERDIKRIKRLFH